MKITKAEIQKLFDCGNDVKTHLTFEEFKNMYKNKEADELFREFSFRSRSEQKSRKDKKMKLKCRKGHQYETRNYCPYPGGPHAFASRCCACNYEVPHGEVFLHCLSLDCQQDLCKDCMFDYDYIPFNISKFLEHMYFKQRRKTMHERISRQHLCFNRYDCMMKDFIKLFIIDQGAIENMSNDEWQMKIEKAI